MDDQSLNEEISKLVGKIERLAKNSELVETKIITALDAHFKKKRDQKYIELYLDKKKSIKDICKEFKISQKTLYKILKENGIKTKTYKKKG
jgi:DNA invertase Pin-like site-specific DNA recombinase